MIAAFVGGLDAFYRLVIAPEITGQEPDLRRLLLFGTFIFILGLMGFIPAAGSLVDMFALMLIVIILLNDGSDFFKAVGGL